MKTKMINNTLKIAGLILGVSFMAPAMAADVVIGSFGGSYQEAQRKALFEPAASKWASVSTIKPMAAYRISVSR